MSYQLIIGPQFKRTAQRLRKKYGSFTADFEQLITELKLHPQLGEALGRDCYKVRMRIKAKNVGKSGSARVITCVKIIGEKIYLLTIYDKSERDSISDKERDELLKENGLI